MVGRVRRQLLAPLAQQARPDHRQQQQRAQRQRQPDQLHHRQCPAPGQRGQAQLPRPAQAPLQASQHGQQQRTGHGRQHRQRAQSTQHPGRQAQVAGGLHRQRHRRRQRQQVGQQRGRRQGGEAAVEHPHRRHPAQPQQRRQAEAQQQQQADAGAAEHRRGLWQRQPSGDQPAQGFHQGQLGQHAQAHPQHAGRDRQQQQLQGQGGEDVALTRAQATQHGDRVDPAQGEAVGRQRGGHPGQQYRQQRRQGQETAGALERLAHAAARVLQGHQAQAAIHPRPQPVRESGDRIGLAGEHQPVGGAAAGSEQAGGLHLLAPDQQGRCHLQQFAGRVRFGLQHPGDAQLAAAELHVIAHAYAQCLQQAWIGPGLARGRGAGSRGVQAVGLARHPQFAAQRIAGVHALDRGHLAGLAMEQHAREGHQAGAAQAACGRFGGELRRRVLAPAHAQVAAQGFGGAGRQRQRHPVHQGAHRSHRRHPQHQGGGHRQQVAGEELPAQRARRMPQRVHAGAPATACRRPLSSR